MKQITFFILLLFQCIIGRTQTKLEFTDVMLFYGNTQLSMSSNWPVSAATELNIVPLTEWRNGIDIHYWTWQNERYGYGSANGYSYMREQNDGISVSVFYKYDELALLLENNTDLHIYANLSSLTLFFCDNYNEGVKNVSPISNTLRNRYFGKYDCVLIPPKKKAEVHFYPLIQSLVFPSTLPSGTIVQYSIGFNAFSSDPLYQIKSSMTDEQYVEEEGAYYFSVDGYISTSYSTEFEARYHCKLK